MRQLNLFEAERPTPERAPVDVAYVRKSLMRRLNMVRAAVIMPWGPADAAHWADFFPKLAALLPPEEGEALARAFAAELTRLRAG